MPRVLSTAATAGMMAGQTGFILLELLTITHAELSTPLRIVNNIEDISSRGDVFTACGFELALPEEKAEGIPKATLTINNADQWMTQNIRNLRGGLGVMIEAVSSTDLAADPPEFDTVERAGMTLSLIEVVYDSRIVRGTLSFESLSGAKFPSRDFTPSDFRGLF